MNAQVEKLMKALDLTEAEALELIEEDKKIDRMTSTKEIDGDLTDEQRKSAKSVRQVDRKPTVYKFDTSKRKRPENVGKRTLISAIQGAMESVGATDMNVTNPEREMTFVVDGVKYKVTLACPRS